MPRIFNDEQCGAKAIWPYPFGTTPIFLQEAKKNLERAPLFPRSFSTSCRKMGDAGAIVKLSPRPTAFRVNPVSHDLL